MNATLLPTALLTVLSTGLLATPSAAKTDGGHDWPQWRGPDRTGVSAEENWSPTGKETPLWLRLRLCQARPVSPSKSRA